MISGWFRSPHEETVEHERAVVPDFVATLPDGRVLLTGRIHEVAEGGMVVEAVNVLHNAVALAASSTVSLQLSGPYFHGGRREKGVIAWESLEGSDAAPRHMFGVALLLGRPPTGPLAVKG